MVNGIEKLENLEKQRLLLQEKLDAGKSQLERNRLGQFATPTSLARDILRHAATLLPSEENVRFLDPAIGTGSFYSALRAVIPAERIAKAVGFEIDPHYGEESSQLWSSEKLSFNQGDFTLESPRNQYNLIICNPPYVRHHHLSRDEKLQLQMASSNGSGLILSGLAGLYCYFLGIAHAWMAEGGIAGWLIPSEFMDVNYGRAVKRYLLEDVTLLRIHRFDPNDVQFADALVSSAVVWFRKSQPPKNYVVEFSLGGSLESPALSRLVPADTLTSQTKWTRFPTKIEVNSRSHVPLLSEFFQIKRGIATGHNGYFILKANEVTSRGLPENCFRPVLPSPRYLPENEISADAEGNPRIDRKLFLLDTRLAEHLIQEKYPSLYTYLQEGKNLDIHLRYLCRHREPWYAQEKRPPAPIVCTYLGRSDAKSGKPFRFILNMSRATVANVYLAMYPTPVLAAAMKQDHSLIRRVWRALNDISPAELIGEGRVYGGGLHKLEPSELAMLDASDIAALIPGFSSRPRQGSLFEVSQK